MLTTYFYVHSTGRKQAKQVTTSEQMEKQTSDTGTMLAALQGASSSSSSSSEVKVKEDNPGWTGFEQKLGLLKAAVGALQKSQAQGQLLISKFEVAGKSDAAMKAKGEDLKKMMSTLESFTQETVGLQAEMEGVKKDEARLSKKAEILQVKTNQAHHHLGGYKEMHKRFPAMLG